MQTHHINSAPPVGDPITGTADIYGCEMPENMPVSITLHPDNDGTGLYVRIRLADNSPLAGLDLTIEQADRLRSALELALVQANCKRVTCYAKSLEVLP